MELSNTDMEASCQLLVEEDVLQLVKVTNDVASQLQGIWREVGLTVEDQKNQIRNLTQEVIKVRDRDNICE